MNAISGKNSQSLTSIILAISLVIYPSCSVVVDDVSGLMALIVMFCGLITAITLKNQIFPLSTTEKVFFLSLVALYSSAIFTSVYNAIDFTGVNRLANFALAIPIYFFFKTHDITEKYLWGGLVLGALITMSMAIYQKFGLMLPRAHGSVHPIMFGNVALIMGCMSLAGTGWFRRQKPWMVAIPLAAFAAGLIGSALSLSRGGWVALPFLGLVVVWYVARNLSIKRLTPILMLFVFLIGVIYLIPQTGIKNRVAVSIDQLDQYYLSTEVNSPARQTSIGVRFEMWKAAWLIFTDNPFTGVGWGNYRPKAKELFEQGMVSRGASLHHHAHNQFFSTLAKGGMLGIIALLLLYLVPFYIFYRSARDERGKSVGRIALAGLVLVVGFASFGLSEAVFERSRTIIFYSFYLCVFMAATLKKGIKHE